MKNPKEDASSRRPRARRILSRGRQVLRFVEVEGKTVEFIEMWADANFPCIEVGFSDKTAIHFVMDTCLTMEPAYANWKTGNQRMLRRWPAIECR